MILHPKIPFLVWRGAACRDARGIIAFLIFLTPLPRFPIFGFGGVFLFFADAKNNRVQSAKFRVQLMNY